MRTRIQCCFPKPEFLVDDLHGYEYCDDGPRCHHDDGLLYDGVRYAHDHDGDGEHLLQASDSLSIGRW